ncbi:MAG: ABC transporter substrate-binding protein [Bradyrhizobium sp.]|nr:ABC transporter substrate-binding protein [Bradyrhizobium sp.]
MPVVGFLHTASPEQTVKRLNAFRKGLEEAGFVEGQNVTIEYRWAEGQNDRLPAMAADLVRRNVAVITTPGSVPATFAAKSATTTIPIVFATGGDPVALSLVASLNRPGGNITGVTSMNADASSKRLDVIRQLVPQAKHYFTLVNPESPVSTAFMEGVAAAATKLRIQLNVLRATNEKEIDAALTNLPQKTGAVLLSSPEPIFYSHRNQIITLAARYGLPAAFDTRDYVDDGGLVSYGADFLDVMQRAGGYVGRVLKGARPADLPVVRSEKFELAINLKTARTLGIDVPPNLVALADYLVE